MLPDEDAAAFQALEAELVAELAPEGALQTVLARRVVAATRRLERAEWIEAELFERERHGPFGEGNLWLALIRDCNGAGAFDTLLRYRGGTLTELWRALRTLKTLQAEAAQAQGAARARPKGPESRGNPRESDSLGDPAEAGKGAANPALA